MDERIRFIRIPEVIKLVGMSKSTIWARSKDGTFPAPRKIGPGVTVWVESEIQSWMKQQLEKSEG